MARRYRGVFVDSVTRLPRGNLFIAISYSWIILTGLAALQFDSGVIGTQDMEMSNVTRLPPFSKTVHVEADIPVSQRDEFEQAIIDIVAGERPRMEALDRDLAAIKIRALLGLQAIEKAINEHPTTGGAKRLVRFLAGLYNGQDYPFDLSELRALDTVLANACLDT